MQYLLQSQQMQNLEVVVGTPVAMATLVAIAKSGQ